MSSIKNIIKFSDNLNKKYSIFKAQSLINRRFKHKDIETLINKLILNSNFEISELGKSTEKRSINLIKFGNGKIKILLWSQMHGDEATATQSFFDIFNFFIEKNEFKTEKKIIIDNLSLYFVPMLNPDGAEVFKRRNALDIDLNRDALRLSAIETRLLKNLRDEINADFGFNLHDQEIYYTACNTKNPASISFLAPAFNNKKTINEGRKKSMQVIALMNNVLQKHIPNQVGKYSDDFMPTAFGDNMQKWGTNTVLIESGGYKNDREKQYVRKLNFIAILSAFLSISENSIENISIENYFEIPDNNKNKLFDIIIRNVTLKKGNNSFLVDIGINKIEINNSDFTDFKLQSKIVEIGDLSQYFAYNEFVNENLIIETEKNPIYIGAGADFLIAGL